MKSHEATLSHVYHIRRASTGTQLKTRSPTTRVTSQATDDRGSPMEVDHQNHEFPSADYENSDPLISTPLSAMASEADDIDPDLLTQHWAQMTQPEPISFGPHMDPIDIFEEVSQNSQHPMLYGQLLRTNEELPQDHPSLYPNSDEDAEGSVEGEEDAEGSTDEEDAEGSIFEEDNEGPPDGGGDEQMSGVQVDGQASELANKSDPQNHAQAEPNPPSTLYLHRFSAI